MKLDLPCFRQRFPWWGGDLQTIATSWLRAEPLAGERMEFTLEDGDTLLARLDQPEKPKTGEPTVVLIHGVPGSECSRYLLRMSRYLCSLGHRVLRLNMRGAGPSRKTCRGQYSAGSSNDLHEFFDQLPRKLPGDGFVAVGYSVGGAVLLKYLGEAGSNTPLLAAASVSAPIDLRGTTWELLRFRNSLYQFIELRKMKREALAEISDLTDAERKNIVASRTIWDFDNLFLGPRHGFEGADDYYAKCSALNFLPRIRKPTLLVASLDDPWVPGSVYSGYYWGSNKHRWGSKKHPCLEPLLQQRGGHVGFHGVGLDQPWSDVAVAKFFAKVKRCQAEDQPPTTPQKRSGAKAPESVPYAE